MDPRTQRVTTGAALLLAAAAILSTPRQASGPFEASRWLRLSTGPAGAAMAGAIAEHPENFIAP
jgi:hypothetical protein